MRFYSRNPRVVQRPECSAVDDIAARPCASCVGMKSSQRSPRDRRFESARGDFFNSYLIDLKNPSITPLIPTRRCKIVSIVLNASSPAKLEKTRPNNPTKVKNAPFTKQKGPQNFSLLHPKKRTLTPTST